MCSGGPSGYHGHVLQAPFSAVGLSRMGCGTLGSRAAIWMGRAGQRRVVRSAGMSCTVAGIACSRLCSTAFHSGALLSADLALGVRCASLPGGLAVACMYSVAYLSINCTCTVFVGMPPPGGVVGGGMSPCCACEGCVIWPRHWYGTHHCDGSSVALHAAARALSCTRAHVPAPA
jgi:hypothetical protein